MVNIAIARLVERAAVRNRILERVASAHRPVRT
jgi:hypothetical protein